MVIRVNYKKAAVLITSYLKKLFSIEKMFVSGQNSFFVKQIVLIFSLIRTAFLSSILNLKNAKNLKNTREELMAIPDIPIDGGIGVYQKMRKKKWKKILIEEL